jgi:polyisoprenoid-binding protein YceI
VPNGNRATITGDLTIKGITKPVTLQAEFVGAGANPMNKKLNFGFRGTGQIKRSDFGLGMAAPVVSDQVDLTINAAFQAA